MNGFQAFLGADDDLIKIFSANKRHLKFIDEVLALLNQACTVNQAIRMYNTNERIGWSLDPCKFILNNSCDPNISIHTCHDKRIIWIVNRPIECGSQILVNVHPIYYNMDGGYLCKQATCIACKNRWRTSINLERVKVGVEAELRAYAENSERLLDHDNLMNQFNTQADFINQNFKQKDYLKNPKAREKFAIKMRLMREIIYFICDQRCLDD